MATVRHKWLGTAEIIRRKGDRIFIKYHKSGDVIELKMPDSFLHDIFEIDAELQREVDAAVEAKKEAERIAREAREAERAKAKAVQAETVSTDHSRKKPAKVKIKGTIEVAFEEYLIASGYSIETPTGKPSVVQSYIRAVNKIMKNEGLTWNSLKTNIDVIVALYGKGGAKESEGLEQHETYINALRRFEDFVNNSIL